MSDFIGNAETLAQEEKVISRLTKRHEDEEVRYTNCWQNGKCFGGSCVVKWRIKDGKPVSVEPDDTIHPENAREDIDEDVNRGLIQGRPCEIAHAFIGSINNPNRIIYPMKRVGERGEGKWDRVSWDEALDTIAEKLSEIKEKYGPYSILSPESAFETSAFLLGPYLQAGICGNGSISFDGPILAMRQWLGHDVIRQYKTGETKWGIGTPEALDLFNSKLIVLWGWNTFARNYQFYPYYIKLARERGIPVICIDPLYNWTAEILADQYIPIRPGTDLAMMLAVAHVLFNEDLYDHEYIDKWVEPEGVEKFKAYVFGEDDEVEKTPEWAEIKCGVPAETIREFARLYAASKPTALRVSESLGRQHRGEYQTAMAIILQAMTGNTSVPGGYHGAVDMGGTFRFPAVPMPGLQFNRAPHEYVAPVMMNAADWHKAILHRDDFDAGKITLDEYNAIIGNEPGNEPPNIKCMIFTSNSVNNYYEINKRIEALKKVEFSFGFHYSFEQVVPRYLDLVLPMSYTVENNDDWTMRDLQFPMSPFMMSTGALFNTMSYSAKLFDPPGEVRDRDWVWTQVANRLGFGEKYNPRLCDVPWEKWQESVEGLHQEAYEAFIASPGVPELFGGVVPSWEEFKKKPIIRMPIDDPHYCYKEHMEAGISPFFTPSGKIEFYATDNENLPNTWHQGYLDPLPRWDVPYMDEPPYDSFFHPKAAEYPLVMVTPVSSYRQHSLHDNNPWLRDEVYRHAVWLSISDAKARDIKDGDLVKVQNDIGELHLPAYVTSRVTPGVVAVYHGAWYTPGEDRTEAMPDGVAVRGACNFLIHGNAAPHVISAFFTQGLVEVEKLGDQS